VPKPQDGESPGLEPTSVSGVFRIPRKNAGGTSHDAVKLRSIEITPMQDSGDGQIAVAEVPIEVSSISTIEEESSEPPETRVVVEDVQDAHDCSPAAVAVNLGLLFSPLLAAAAPPLESEQVVEANPAVPTPPVHEVSTSEPSSESETTAPSIHGFEAEQAPFDLKMEFSTEAAPDQPTTVDSLEQSFQSLWSLPMASASIRHESSPANDDSAESAKSGDIDATKKKQRPPLRRPPLHRRFQFDRADPVPSSVDPSAGTEVMNRNVRVDQPGGTADSSAAPSQNSVTSSVAPETKIVSNSAAGGRRFRIDAAESIDEIAGTGGRRARTQGRARDRYIDAAHDSVMRGPHFEITAPKRSNLTALTGQFLAYMGVLGLTIGTAMVIYGHFGGYAEYTPTGWLVTTVAQMLLFLGVINLVSGGIEQNNEDVSRRISTLGDQLLRIEQVTSEVLRGPKISAERYDNPESEQASSIRETAGRELE
ncbi:MAG: hypothetical protein ACK58L_19010, partial [Planctomycetota bacterium]